MSGREGCCKIPFEPSSSSDKFFINEITGTKTDKVTTYFCDRYIHFFSLSFSSLYNLISLLRDSSPSLRIWKDN